MHEAEDGLHRPAQRLRRRKDVRLRAGREADYFDRLDRQLRKAGTDVIAATRELIAAGLVGPRDGERDRARQADQRLKLALRDEPFLTALALRMPTN
jgi:hypothetical protein